MALVANLTGVFHLSKDDAKQLIADLYDIDVSDGSIINVEERVTQALNPIYNRIHGFVTESIFCKHFDETSWRDCGKTHYVWVASTKQAVCYRIDRHRSKEAFKAIAGSLNKLAPVVTDRYNVYNDLKNPRQFCIPHLIRNFRRFAQRDGPDGRIGSAVEKELQFLSHTHSLYRKTEISRAAYSQRIRHCRSRVDDLFMDALAEGSEDLGKLCEKLLLDEFDNLWTFQSHHDAEPSNNLAERDLRKIVLWRKKSYGTRSDRGQAFVQTVSSVAGTLRRSGANIFSFLTKAVERFYQGLDAPMIQPNHGF
jgi:transposase